MSLFESPSGRFVVGCKGRDTGRPKAAETINIALRSIKKPDTPILCLDGDNFYTVDITTLWNGQNGVIKFEDVNDSEIYSYVEIIEKQKISNFACTGAYGFASYKELFKY
jgi:hypothetical protein